jgi:hypothetical protein
VEWAPALGPASGVPLPLRVKAAVQGDAARSQTLCCEIRLHPCEAGRDPAVGELPMKGLGHLIRSRRGMLRASAAIAVLLLGAVAAGCGGDEGWATRDENAVLGYLQGPDVGFTTNRAACTLEVYEQYFSTYEDFRKSGDSPARLMATATAERRCSGLTR